MKKIIAWIGAGCLSLIPVAASADIATYTVGTGNSAISGFTGPYETATVDLTSPTTATITFTSDTNAGNIYLMGDGGTVGINVNATSWTLGPITGSNAGTGFTNLSTDYSNGGAGNEDGFGSFNQTINTFDGFAHAVDTISFTITNTSGTWASASQVLTANASGNVVAAHVFVTASPANQSNGAIVTGFATDVPSNTPLPGALALFGSVLLGGLGAGTWRRRYRRGPVSVMGSPVPVTA
jgi:hypothetical protein